MKKMDKKAFTLIELIVVIAVVGILVLLGTPRFIGHTQRAELAKIQHDVKVMEQEIGTEFINKDDDFDKWENNNKDFNQLIQEGKLFEKEGIVKKVESTDETYKVIPEEYKSKINTKLKGTFYANSAGKVYYEHVKQLVGMPTEPEKAPEHSDEKIEGLIEKGYIPVATAEDLNSIINNTERIYGEGTKWEGLYTGGLDKQYIQVANIDLSVYSEEGWNPIGTLDGNATSESDMLAASFTGTYDGGNYVITDLEVKGEDKNYQGLFGFTLGATIRNVGLIDNKVTGQRNIGGLVGASESTEISNSYATGEVTGTDNYAGGLVGASENSMISNSYSTGSVTGTSQVGGLVGWSGSLFGASSIISNSYATGSVTGSGEYVGGLVGTANWSTIENSYATGEVTGTGTQVGGLVGSAKASTKISNSYWDTETTLQEESAGGVGMTTEDMKTKATYTGWDFDNVWEIVNGEYPKLR